MSEEIKHESIQEWIERVSGENFNTAWERNDDMFVIPKGKIKFLVPNHPEKLRSPLINKFMFDDDLPPVCLPDLTMKRTKKYSFKKS